MSFIDQLIANTIRADVRAASGYHVPESPGYIKLDAMENPYELPAPLRAELARRLAEAVLNRYPVPSYATLKHAICAKLGVPEGYDVILGNGSDELISIIAMATARQDRRAVIVAPIPAFVMYQRSAQFAGMDFVGVPLLPDFSLDQPAMLAAIREHKPAVLFLAYPNNPTGNLYDAADMAELIDALGDTGIAVVDEAYEPFARTSFMGHLPEFENLVVMRTLSKLGLAGIRLGYMSAAPALLAQFDKVRPPYNISVLNYECALFALAHQDVFAAQAEQIRAQRAMLLIVLRTMPEVKAWDSDANMILVRILAKGDDGGEKAQKVFDGLKARGILVKNVSKMHPLLANCLRLTVGTADENLQLLTALKESL